jgi:hypothetical protein
MNICLLRKVRVLEVAESARTTYSSYSETASFKPTNQLSQLTSAILNLMILNCGKKPKLDLTRIRFNTKMLTVKTSKLSTLM